MLVIPLTAVFVESHFAVYSDKKARRYVVILYKRRSVCLANNADVLANVVIFRNSSINRLSTVNFTAAQPAAGESSLRSECVACIKRHTCDPYHTVEYALILALCVLILLVTVVGWLVNQHAQMQNRLARLETQRDALLSALPYPGVFLDKDDPQRQGK
ncbi:uncharacterized protein LOC129600735 [Paramacrobiotus metropolitanus]|uniref:uncharacterized protein LOC129600735 n=1 Tax=Paramacrobiotus metropolitanus TaxID=2943436 RepID=UPI0024458FE7|nr:uncharacterized protein LOC129600735 [Paramacrobiotus metropolitanus]